MSGQSTAAKLAAARRRIAELEAEVAQVRQAARLALGTKNAMIRERDRVIETLRGGTREDATP